MRSSILIALALALSAAPSLARAFPQSPPVSAHAAELASHANDPPFVFPPRPDWIFSGPTARAPRVNRIVYGYYPYWVDQWDELRWDLLTHIAFFSVGMNSNGSLGVTHGWPNTSFVETAHMFGVKVDVTFTLFDGDGIATLCGSAANRATAIANMIDAIEAGGADGVNIDFEGVPGSTRDDFTTFIGELRSALASRGHADAGIGIAGPAVDWSDAFDLGALAPLIDVYFIMGYGYHWNGSTSIGPNGQLRVGSAWRPHTALSMERTLDHYTSLVPAELRTKIVLGVPYYGIEWPADSDQLFAGATGGGSSVTYAAARRALEAGISRFYDRESENAWYAHLDNAAWKQAWYDDEESLAAKYRLALEQGIGGIGMWALGYDEQYTELWDTLDAYFTELAPPKSGSRESPIVIDHFPYTDANDTKLAPSNWFNRYACAPSTPEYGREWVYTFDVCRAGTINIGVTDGAGVDIDLHLLSAAREDACLARDDAAISKTIGPGAYFISADTFVSSYVAQAGAYELTVDFIPDDPAAGCRSNEICRQGRCERAGDPPIVPQASAAPEPQEVNATISPPDMPPAAEQPDVQAETLSTDGGCSCSSSLVSSRPMMLADMLMIISLGALLYAWRITSRGSSS